VIGDPHRRTQEREHNPADHRLVDRVLVGHLLSRRQYRIEAVLDHLRLIAGYRFDEPESAVGDVDDPCAEQDSVPQRRVRTHPTTWCHGMDGVADQRDIAGGPGIDRHRGLDVDREARAGIGQLEESAQVRMPIRRHVYD